MPRLSTNDPNSYAQPEKCITKDMLLTVELNFEKKKLAGKVQYIIEKVDPSATEIILDVKDITVASIIDADTKKPLEHTTSDAVPNFGGKLTVKLPENPKRIIIEYETASNATGLQWLTPEQTNTGKHPFVFSQCQAIHARSLVPCQDTPSVKFPYTAQITAPVGITVLMSAKRTGTETCAATNKTITLFVQGTPIPSYLLAIAAGHLESRKLGERSNVWAEPNVVELAALEFSETEKMLQTAEAICGKYEWGIYDLLVLPASFPYGGMENPCLTFVTPALIAGDKSLALVIAHEIAHSWTGNLVTNSTFEHFWLNEGMTVFVERKIAGRMKGAAVQDFEATTGVSELQETIKRLGETSPLTNLVVNLDETHPDDAYSIVPYEKGSIFLRYLENLVGGPENFEPFLKSYLQKYKFKSVNTDQFKADFTTHFASKSEEIAKIDWETWLNKPGMPPIIPEYDTSLVKICQELKEKWIKYDDNSESIFTNADIADMTPNQKQHFLQLLLEHEPLSVNKLKKMEEAYKFGDSPNIEIKCRWLRIGLKAKWADVVDEALKMASGIGRMKYVRPIYQDLYAWEEYRQKAIDHFNANKTQMMQVSVHTVSKDLHLI